MISNLCVFRSYVWEKKPDLFPLFLLAISQTKFQRI